MGRIARRRKPHGKGSPNYQDVNLPLGLNHKGVYDLLEPLLNLDLRRANHVEMTLLLLQRRLFPPRLSAADLKLLQKPVKANARGRSGQSGPTLGLSTEAEVLKFLGLLHRSDTTDDDYKLLTKTLGSGGGQAATPSKLERKRLGELLLCARQVIWQVGEEREDLRLLDRFLQGKASPASKQLLSRMEQDKKDTPRLFRPLRNLLASAKKATSKEERASLLAEHAAGLKSLKAKRRLTRQEKESLRLTELLKSAKAGAARAEDAKGDLLLLRKALLGSLPTRDNKATRELILYDEQEADRLAVLLTRRPIALVLVPVWGTQPKRRWAFAVSHDWASPQHLEQRTIDTCAYAIATVALDGETEIFKCPKCKVSCFSRQQGKGQCASCRRRQQPDERLGDKCAIALSD